MLVPHFAVERGDPALSPSVTSAAPRPESLGALGKHIHRRQTFQQVAHVAAEASRSPRPSGRPLAGSLGGHGHLCRTQPTTQPCPLGNTDCPGCERGLAPGRWLCLTAERYWWEYHAELARWRSQSPNVL